ncbi:response regulator transcription factor [Bacillus alkalicellulosilyticus]|uniref:response regulator transcription factor n=1 Tax=Alkalihalobacterium alkalicellulosilyticum TaxID=1912214 RepID=UPI000996E5BA|nr:response regulator [Bacillus alkalicellulosilyticus]
MKRLLLAEDEDVLRMLIMDTLEDEGYAIDEASDGLQALAAIQENEYDLILLDYMMPGMSGIEVIEKVREMEEKNHVKILMLTAKSQKKDEEAVIEAGADYFLAKPFSPLKLAELVEDILHG